MNTKNKRDLRRLQNSTFLVVTLGIIFDPKTIKILGCVFARIFKENKKVLLMYYLCETISRSIKPKGDLEELKWVSPEGIEKHFTTSLDSRLKEYLMNLK